MMHSANMKIMVTSLRTVPKFKESMVEKAVKGM
jgi:hypothetical protein